MDIKLFPYFRREAEGLDLLLLQQSGLLTKIKHILNLGTRNLATVNSDSIQRFRQMNVFPDKFRDMGNMLEPNISLTNLWGMALR